MRRTIICCDKCNEEITSQGYSLKCEPLSETEMVPYAPLDLCQNCLIETFNFATGAHLYKRVPAVEIPDFKQAVDDMVASQPEPKPESTDKKYKPMDRTKVHELMLQGYSATQISRKLGCEYSGCAKYVREHKHSREPETEVERV